MLSNWGGLMKDTILLLKTPLYMCNKQLHVMCHADIPHTSLTCTINLAIFTQLVQMQCDTVLSGLKQHRLTDVLMVKTHSKIS